MAARDSDRALGVVFVCRGNRFRSPLAAALFKRAAPPDTVLAESFGTLAVGPLPPLPEAVEHAARLGVDLSGHRARPLVPGGLADAELVVGFELSHVASAVIEGGAPREHAFTLTELDALLGDVGAAGDGTARRARTLRDAAHAARRSKGLRAGTSSDIPDPVGAPRAAQGAIADRIDGLVGSTCARLFGARAPEAGR